MGGRIIMMHKDVYYKMSDFDVSFNGDYTEETWCDLVLEDIVDTDVVNQLVWMVYKRFFEFYAYKKEIPYEEEPSLPTNEDTSIFTQRLNNIIDLTYERYAPLLKMYRDNADNPSPQLESSSEGKTRFNDTPQDDDLNDEYYADDEHATNVTASLSSSKADSGSLVERLDALYRNWRDILRDWTNEFKGLFREVWR